MNNSFSQVALRLLKLVLVLACLLVCQAQNSQLRGQQQQGCGNGDMVCQVFESPEKELGTLESGSLYECVQGGMSYDLVLPQPFIDTYYDLLDDGSTFVSIPGGCIVNGTTVEYPSNTTISVLPEQEERRRHLMTSEGNKTLLVVYVTKGHRTWYPRPSSLKEYIFGDRPGSLVNQLHSCSQGKMKFQMAEGPGIVNGFYHMQVDVDHRGMYRRDYERLHVLPKMDAVGGESAFDHVMYCFPEGTTDHDRVSTKWSAYGIVNHPRSVYNGENCAFLSSMGHEIGHNLGLHHSNQWGRVYADVTGLMGGGSRRKYEPKSCYNAQKHWQLGWYEESSLDLTRSIRNGAWGGRMLPFVDAQHATDYDVVIVRIGNIYVQYNRAKDYNVGTRRWHNKVVIVKSDGKRVPQSDLLTALGQDWSSPTSYTISNFERTGHDLVFEVCNQVMNAHPDDYVHLSIHLDDGTQSSQCKVPLPVSTLSPTSAPSISIAPSISPTLSPSASPTVPTNAPSSSPTGSLEPSGVPTKAPSSSPTEGATPTPEPTTSPTAAPTMDCTGTNVVGAVVPVGNRNGRKSCDWIAQRKGWKQFLCRPGFDAYEKCQETCDSCNAQNTTSIDTCEDSHTLFPVNGALGERRCWQLEFFFERNPRWKDKLCAPNQPAYDHCPEACGKCTDTCEDQDVSFEINKRFGIQNCAWLARRPLWQAFLCYPGHAAYEYCNELCNTCS